MLLPLLLIFLATLASAVVAYGVHPSWAQYEHGLNLILWSRRVQWPLVAVAIICCVALLGLIAGGKRRAWWLIGLGPVVALFVHRFHLKPGADWIVSDNPPMIAANDAAFLQDDTFVVGLVFDGQAYAFAYPGLFRSPAVVVQQREKKFLLVWSPDANRAMALSVDRDLRGRDLEVVSTPANSTLLYNSRLGEFIVGVTGQTPDGQTPRGVRSVLPISKTTWGNWRVSQPQSLVMSPLPPGDWPFALPAGPILPRFPMPPGVSADVPPLTRIAIVQSTGPAAIVPDQLPLEKPANLTLGNDPVLLIRDAAGVRAYDRRIDQDLFVRLKPAGNNRRPGAAYIDDSSNSLWNRQLTALEGPPEIKGKKLARLPVEEELYWGVMKYWQRDLQLYKPTE